MLNARIRPQMSFAPALLGAIETPGSDRLARAIVKELGPLAAPMVQRWKSLPNAGKTRRHFLRRPQPWLHDTSLDLRGRIAAFAGAYAAAQKSLAQARKKVLQTEYRRYVQAGPAAYQPSAALAADAVLFADFQRYLGAKFGTNGCRCEKPGGAEPPPATPRPKHGVLTQEQSSHEISESTTAKQRVVLRPGGSGLGTLVTLDASLATAISGAWTLNTGLLVRYASRPAAGQERTDTLLTFGFGHMF
jgi:hypothetical protein